MENKINKKIFGIVTLVMVTLFLTSLVSAGITFKKVIEVYPEQVLTENLLLQNLGADNPDLIFEASIREGSEVVSMTSTELAVPNGEIGEFPLEIRAPAGSSIGDSFNVKMVFRSIPETSGSVEGAGSGLQFIKSVGISFDVKVIAEPIEPETPQTEELGMGWIFLGVIAVVALIAIIWMVIKSKSETSITPANKSGKSVKISK